MAAEEEEGNSRRHLPRLSTPRLPPPISTINLRPYSRALTMLMIREYA
jgi:hypothetical protein